MKKRTKYNIICITWIFWIILFISACAPRQIEIFPLRQLTYTRDNTIKREYFVIANIPGDHETLAEFIGHYNRNTLSQMDIIQYEYYFRIFYKETRFTPRNYKEKNKGYFNHDRIEFHARDAVLEVKWSNFGESEEYHFFSRDELP